MTTENTTADNAVPAGSQVVAIPVTPDGGVEPRFGKAPQMAVATVANGEIIGWRVEKVEWDVLHDQGEHGQHHARIVRFMRDNNVTVAAAGHMGPPMVNTLGKLGLAVVLGVPDMPARDAVKAVVEKLAEEE